MNLRRDRGAQSAMLSLEADAASARGGLARMFSTSDEYESALIDERRAQGRYQRRSPLWPLVLLAGCVVMMAGTMLLWQ